MRDLLLIEILGTPIVLALMVWVARPRELPVGMLVRAWRWATRTRAGKRSMLLLVGLLGVDLVQSHFDPALTRGLGYDLTGRVLALEGEAVARVQAVVLPYLPGAARLALSFFYLAGYIATLLLPLVLFHGEDRAERLVRRVWMGALFANYVLALPFYFFVPVDEVSRFPGAGARPVLEEVLPGVTAALRRGSALNNCFPSLHVSCSVAAWWCSRRLGGLGVATAGLTRAAGLSALLTSACVVVLGIHWLADCIAGLAFGLLCAELGLFYSDSQRAAVRA